MTNTAGASVVGNISECISMSMSIGNLILMTKAKDEEETDRYRKGSPHHILCNIKSPETFYYLALPYNNSNLVRELW